MQAKSQSYFLAMLATFLLSTCLPAKSDAQVRNRMENWYTNWGIGYPFIEYPSPITGTAQLDNASIMLDLLGFYWPLDEQMILGGTINGWGDRYAAGGEHVQINAYTFGFSIMRFLQARVGDGFFLRSDIGPSRIVVDSSVLTSNLESDWGLGILVGGGYGFPVSPETRVLLHLNYSVRRIEGEQFTNFGIGVSGLF